jgi:hypothetical protein
MFRSATDHHQEVHVFLVKITELKCEYSDVVMRQHNIFCLYVVSGVVRRADFAESACHTTYIHCMLCCRIATYEYSYFNSVILTRNT